MIHELPRGEMTELSRLLGRFVETDSASYEELFLREIPLATDRLPGDLAALLRAAGLVRTNNDVVTPSVRVNSLPEFDVLICTDLCSYEEPDQVFPIHAEQLLVVGNSLVQQGDAVLELGVGSGVLTCVAARRGARVTAVDINPRALRYARFNRLLNSVVDSVELLESDWFHAVEGRTFDRILSNPPFEPAPEGFSHFLHSGAGTDGMDVIRTLLRQFDPYLRTGGSLELVTYSIARPAMLLAEIAEPLPGRKRLRYLPQEIPLAEFMEKYAEQEALPPDIHDKSLVLVVLLYEKNADNSIEVEEIPVPEAARYPDVLLPVGYDSRGPTIPRNSAGPEACSPPRRSDSPHDRDL